MLWGEHIMNNLIFIFSILLIIGLTIALSLLVTIYFKTKKKEYLLISLLITCYLIDATFLHFSDFFIHLTNNTLPETYISNPLFKSSLYSMILLLYLALILYLHNIKFEKKYLSYFLVFFALQLYVSILPETNLIIWIFYSLRQFFSLSLGILYFILCFKKRHDSSNTASRFKMLFLCLLICNIGIIIEDSFVISQQEVFTTSNIIMIERNFTENIFWLFISFTCMIHGLKHLFVVDKSIRHQLDYTTIFDQIHFTPREREITLLLLDHLETSEIAQKLCISPGTLKTHLHNIYTKSEVKHRNELIKKIKGAI